MQLHASTGGHCSNWLKMQTFHKICAPLWMPPPLQLGSRTSIIKTMNTTQSTIQTVDRVTTLPLWLLHQSTFALCSIAVRNKQRTNENTKLWRAARNWCGLGLKVAVRIADVGWLTRPPGSVSLNFVRCFCKLWTFLHATQSIINQSLCMYVCLSAA